MRDSVAGVTHFFLGLPLPGGCVLPGRFPSCVDVQLGEPRHFGAWEVVMGRLSTVARVKQRNAKWLAHPRLDRNASVTNRRGGGFSLDEPLPASAAECRSQISGRHGTSTTSASLSLPGWTYRLTEALRERR